VIPDREALGRDVIGARELADALLLLGRLDPVERDVEVAPIDEVEELVVVALVELGLDAELLGDRLGDLDLEPDAVVRVGRVLEDVGRAALGVGAPAERAGPLDAGERVFALELLGEDGPWRREKDEQARETGERGATYGKRNQSFPF
jgi:hypothetical protein